ncbi:MAG: hypothetical protein QOH99_361 [Frankiaceae bacterium]|jgi:AcrR family transcriptional regulator|nr:hypothetical protein [Frankiaceae bacterium]
MTTPVRSARARPLPPDERRALLVAATIPLLITHGPQVTTRQVAAAAGVAEGTIFRVFDDKDALIRECIAVACDPAPMYAELAAIDIDLPLRERLTDIVTTLQLRLGEIIRLMTAVRMSQPPNADHRRHGRDRNDAIYTAVERLLAPDAARFRIPVHEVARLVRLLTFSGSHELIADGRLLTPDQIVGLLLDGVCLAAPTD